MEKNQPWGSDDRHAYFADLQGEKRYSFFGNGGKNQRRQGARWTFHTRGNTSLRLTLPQPRTFLQNPLLHLYSMHSLSHQYRGSKDVSDLVQKYRNTPLGRIHSQEEYYFSYVRTTGSLEAICYVLRLPTSEQRQRAKTQQSYCCWLRNHGNFEIIHSPHLVPRRLTCGY